MAKTMSVAQRAELLPFLRKLLITVAVGFLVLLMFLLRDIWVLAFAAVIAGVGLRSAARSLSRITGLSHKWGLAIASLLLVGVLVGAVAVAWPQIQAQLPILLERLRDSVNEIEARFNIQLPDTADEFAGMGDALWAGAAAVLTGIFAAAASFVLVIVAGIFIAAEPRTYRNGLVLLFPQAWHAKVREAMTKTGDGLILWLRAQVIAMLVVGVLTGVGAWAIGLPSPLALGLIAGLTEFIPIIGPLIAILPAIVIAFADSNQLLIMTIILYVFIQQFEGNLLTPLLQRRIVDLPPVIFLFSLVGLGIVFGIGGIIIAAPLTVVVYTLVRELYVRDLLKEGNLLKEKEPPLKETIVTSVATP